MRCPIGSGTGSAVHSVLNIFFFSFDTIDLVLDFLLLIHQLSLFVSHIVELPLNKKALIPHQDLLVHKQAPCHGVQAKVEVVIVAIVTSLHVLGVLVDHDFDFLHLLHVMLKVYILRERGSVESHLIIFADAACYLEFH